MPRPHTALAPTPPPPSTHRRCRRTCIAQKCTTHRTQLQSRKRSTSSKFKRAELIYKVAGTQVLKPNHPVIPFLHSPCLIPRVSSAEIHNSKLSSITNCSSHHAQ
ncbi:hypothetical protein K505DRAFT_51668 [Melanomma pulvis-pyrius CBS 109.77]|uniref:Uncharacterized protein n=1 Tax=Melanomma pulvis-pyrius CBS 109.77 TaxID=1314802 RepID=A0A6A6X7Y3_9PLEO|nr:hypothetical protein K505DRAFT_51668 [Melanomma pulvis-pyrius CBS 109.77]